MQQPVIGYIDGIRLIRITITQSAQREKYGRDDFAIIDENQNTVAIASAVAKRRSIYLTGEFFDWKISNKGKMLWNQKNNYYYCELPRKQVMNKAFKFLEDSCNWYPAGENLVVDANPGSFLHKGYLICDDKVRFILTNRGFGFTTYELELNTEIDLKPEKKYYLTCHGKHKIELLNRDIFDHEAFFYRGSDLGFAWKKERTAFKVWSPVADEMKLLLFDSSISSDPFRIIEMQRAEKGIWYCELEGNYKNCYYLYEITIDGRSWQQVDPYSRALSINSEKSLIFDKNETYPDGWNLQKQPELKSPLDAVIYELHVRDFTISSAWNGPGDFQGKYTGIGWSGKIEVDNKEIMIGLDHLKELGVNTIQLLPVYDFNSVDETGKDPQKLRNWGYDPFAYNVPEGSYANYADDHRRLLEFREMIADLHNNGFKVVMDVVYNHTANVGAPFSIFDTFMPEYFYRMDRAGHYTNGSGCGNEVASEKKMVRKYILDSLKYWVKEFHIDGFRFDLMGLIDVQTMKRVVKELRKLKKDVLIYGEPWSGGASPLKKPAIKGTQKNNGFAVFNDDFRDSLRGDTDGTLRGWALGNSTSKDTVIKGMLGSIDLFTAEPSETINYVSAHDNYTWYDKIVRSTPELDEESRIRYAKLGLAMVITSQGIPFLHAGCEFLRTKRTEYAREEDVRNSYRANDDVNKLDWLRKAEYYDVFLYVKRLIEIRKNYPGLRLDSTYAIRERIKVISENIPDNMIILLIQGKNVDTDLLMIYNSSLKQQKIILPDGIWRVIFDNDFAERKKQAFHIDTEITVDPVSTTILELD